MTTQAVRTEVHPHRRLDTCGCRVGEVIGSRRHLLRAACTGTTLVTAEQEALPALIAGIYGMNLQGIPMTKLSHGYFIVIVFMAAVVLGHFWFFYRRGWFK